MNTAVSGSAVRKMTKREVLTAIDAFKTDWRKGRDGLLAMFEGQAHLAMGRADFPEFAQIHLDINVSERTIKYHLQAARVEREIAQFRDRPGAFIAPLPMLAAVELDKLPVAEMIEVLDTYRASKDRNDQEPQQQVREIGRLVAARLRAKLFPAPGTEAATPPRKRADMTPVVPPTYDRGPEHDDDTPSTLANTPEIDLPEDDTDALAATEVVPPVSAEGRMEVYLRRFCMHMLSGSRDELECLHVEVREFLKKYVK